MATTHKEVIRYNREGQLSYIEIVGVDWPAFLDIVERETGQRFLMSPIPPGGLHIRIEDPKEGWEGIIKETIYRKDPRAKRTLAEPTPSAEPISVPTNTEQSSRANSLPLALQAAAHS